MATTFFAALLVCLTYLTQVSAFWRMECRGVLGYGRIDPLMSPGTASQHTHTLFGAQNIGFSSDYDSITQSSCTSCIVNEDKSNYWTPAMYFMSEDGQTFTRVSNVGGMLAYYLLNGDTSTSNITAFPEGFRLISGNTYLRDFPYAVPDPPKSDWTGADASQASLAQKALGFNCLNYAKDPEPSLYRHTMPNKTFIDENCADGMRLELMFPSCWNGKDVDSPDHKSHMAFPTEVMTGTCPEGFETRLVSLFYETIWDTTQFAGQAGEFVMANGDPIGTGYHGDFMMGWNEDFLQQAVDTCTNLSGEVEDCPLFSLQSQSDAQQCQLDLPSSIASENTTGPRQGLPGNVQVTYGPAPANETTSGSSDSGSSGSFVPVAASSNTKPTVAGYTAATSTDAGYDPTAGIFAEVAPSSAAAMTTSPPEAGSANPTIPLYTSTYTSNGEIIHMVMFEEDVTITVTSTSTATASANAQKRHEHAHVHRHLRGRTNF